MLASANVADKSNIASEVRLLSMIVLAVGVRR